MLRHDFGGQMTNAIGDSPINAALRQFEAAEANLEKLQRVWGEIEQMTPSGIAFGGDPKYDDRVRAYEDILSGLPMIDGWKPGSVPMDLDAIGQSRLDAKEVGEINTEIMVEREIEAPGRELADYRHRLNRKRRQLIRSAMSDLIARFDETLEQINTTIPADAEVNQRLGDNLGWDGLRNCVQAIDTLLGSSLQRPSGWSDLRRHLHFAMVQDFRDITRLDWPSVKSALTQGLYDKDEPVPVEVEDLGTLAATQPTGAVATKLKWETLTDEEFERLVFALISSTRNYENPSWLTRTNAPDRGRDLSATRVAYDQLSGAMRSRVIIQCKHWLSKSVSLADLTILKAAMSLWEPPKVDVLIVATSGRFTTDGLDFVEKHNQSNQALRIEMWPESHLERLLAERPALIAEFRLR
jgi:hypothetical protein